jgi:hypothetical protein
MANAPKVVMDKDGGRVRLRNISHALTGCIIDGNSGQEIRFSLEPNRWTKVHPAVFNMLESKFDNMKEREVPDWEPGGEGQAPVRRPRMEENPGYIMEFKKE